MSKTGKKVLLMILDGWGLAQNKEVSAIDKASTTFIDSLYENYPHAKLNASGMAVGLPDGQMGNSEVGHMNIGAGKVVYQDLVRINKAVEDGSMKNNSTLQRAFAHALENDKKVHLMGLVSDGGVHSHLDHLKSLVSIAHEAGVEDLFVHAFTDGRDTDPKSGVSFLGEIEDHLEATCGQLATVVGRYYAMDRDKRWHRIKLAYDCLVNGIGQPSDNLLAAIEESYRDGVTDEFLKPMVAVNDKGEPLTKIEAGDVVLCFNFRTDRGRQITVALTQQNFAEEQMQKLPLYYLTFTNYDDTFENVKVVFEKDNLENTLGEIVSNAGKKQIRIAETEKYPHVTFFFSGGREQEFEGEKRILCPSPKVATYDLQPEMSAADIRDAILPELNSGWADFVCLNFANPDMVGHTGVFEAAVKACETVDKCSEAVVEAAFTNDYLTIIIADHGNSDMMINPDGTPNTAHTTNLVPCIIVDKDYSGNVLDGKLGDLAPTILKIMDLAIPEEMTGKILIDA